MPFTVSKSDTATGSFTDANSEMIWSRKIQETNTNNSKKVLWILQDKIIQCTNSLFLYHTMFLYSLLWEQEISNGQEMFVFTLIGLQAQDKSDVSSVLCRSSETSKTPSPHTYSLLSLVFSLSVFDEYKNVKHITILL